MRKQIFLGVLILMNQATLQAADGLDVQQPELVDDLWITLPTDSGLCATDQGQNM